MPNHDMQINPNYNKCKQFKPEWTESCINITKLGCLLIEDTRSHEKIKIRIAMGKTGFFGIREMLRGGLSNELKKRLIGTLVTGLRYNPTCLGNPDSTEKDITVGSIQNVVMQEDGKDNVGR